MIGVMDCPVARVPDRIDPAELIGCPGNCHPDYEVPVSEYLKEEIFSCLKAIKKIYVFHKKSRLQ